MKINTITMQNFLCYENNSIGLTALNILTGPNGAGKTAVKDAIQFALTGKIDRQPIRYGAKKAVVQLEAEGILIERQITNSGQKMSLNINGEDVPGTVTNKQARLMEYLGTTEDVVRAALNTHRFLQLTDDERKKLVFDVLDIRITRDLLKAWLEKQRDDLDVDAILDQLETQQEWEYNDVKGNRKFATEMRRQFKRELQRISALIDGMEDTPPNVNEMIEKAEKKLNELQQELNKLYESKGAASGKKIKEITDEIDKLQQKKEAVLAKIGKLNEEKAILKRDIELLQDEIARMGRLGKVCVLSEDIPCPMKKEEVSKVLGDREKQLDKWKKELKALEKKVNPLKKQRAEIENAIQALVKQKADARWQDPEIEKGIRELEARIQKGRLYIQDLQSKVNNSAKRAELEEQAAMLQLKIDVWDLLEKAYGERGVRADLLRKRMDELRERANITSEILGLGEFDFVTQDGNKEVFLILVNGNPVENYSGGEQHAIGLVLQDALAYASGLRLLVLDEANMFVSELREHVNQLFFQLMEDYDTIIIIKAAEEQSPDPGVDSVQILWLGQKVMETV